MQIFGFNQFELIGLAGVAFYLGSYAALQTGFIRGSGYAYAVFNLIASSLVLISLAHDFNLSSAIIQISWILISTYGLLRLFYIRNAMRFDDRERALIHVKLSGLPNDIGRKLLANGRWQTLPVGSVMIVEDSPVTDLHFILSGAAGIRRGNEQFATAEAGDFLGEVTCFTGGRATGTVVLTQESELFSVNAVQLRELAPAGSSLRNALEIAIADDLRRKLARRKHELIRTMNNDAQTREIGKPSQLPKDVDMVSVA